MTKAIQHFHGPQMHVFPMMPTGASDGSFFRAKGIPVYDVDGSWGISPLDDRAHGLDERMPVRAMYDDVVYWEMIYQARWQASVRRQSAPPSAPLARGRGPSPCATP